mmetsp:Transcript_85243/g.246082  ORF Transcript_85243/g.246082 Transcript_85243/m.246082 type:complete len:247 (+) Transcript_85243:613-1353(+)
MELRAGARLLVLGARNRRELGPHRAQHGRQGHVRAVLRGRFGDVQSAAPTLGADDAPERCLRLDVVQPLGGADLAGVARWPSPDVHTQHGHGGHVRPPSLGRGLAGEERATGTDHGLARRQVRQRHRGCLRRLWQRGDHGQPAVEVVYGGVPRGEHHGVVGTQEGAGRPRRFAERLRDAVGAAEGRARAPGCEGLPEPRRDEFRARVARGGHAPPHHAGHAGLPVRGRDARGARRGPAPRQERDHA